MIDAGMEIVTNVVILVAVVVGGALQRLAGMGFAMVVAPFVVLVLAGQQGVVLTNLLGAAAGLMLIWPVRQDIDWRRFALLAVSTLGGAAVGAALVSSLDIAVFRIVVGVVLLVAIGLSLRVGRVTRHVRGPSGALLAGGATGTLVTISGIGGPPMSVYAVASAWPHRSFAATMQPYVAFASLMGATAVLIAAPGSLPDLPIWLWLATVTALIGGLVAGNALSAVIPEKVGRLIVVVLGVVGAVLTIFAGAGALLSS